MNYVRIVEDKKLGKLELWKLKKETKIEWNAIKDDKKIIIAQKLPPLLPPFGGGNRSD